MFYCNVDKEDDRKELCINGEYFVLNGNEKPQAFQNQYSKRYKKYYYYSEDDADCGWTQRQSWPSAHAKYLSSYGSTPSVFEGLFEQIARISHHQKMD